MLLCLQAGLDPAAAVAALSKQGLNLHPSAVTSTRLDFESRKLPHSVIRASVHYYNTAAEVEQLVKAVGKLTAARLGTAVAGQQQFTAAGLLFGHLFRARIT